jgi:peptide/nickel transport system permease protein
VTAPRGRGPTDPAILKRLLLSIPTLIGVSLIVFFMIRIVPGDIVQQFAGDQTVTPELRERIERELGLDGPQSVQYLRWMGGIVRLDFGQSLRDRSDISSRMTSALPTTLTLSVYAMIISLMIAIPVGVLAAIRQDSLADYLARSVSIGFLAVPSFWLGTMIIVYASVWFAMATPPAGQYQQFWEAPYANLKFLVFPFGYFVPVGPSVVLGVALSGTVMRLTRAQMLEVLRQDYVRTAWSKGLRERSVVVGHAMKNALIPVITVIGLQIPILVGGSVIVESIYNVPGMGRWLFTAIGARDYTAVQAIALVLAVAVVVTNLLVDISYAYLDPRIRYS